MEKSQRKVKLNPSMAYSRKLRLSEIQELVMVIVIVKRENERFALETIKKNKGIVLSRSRGKGVSRLSVLNSIGAFMTDLNVVFAMVRREEEKQMIESLEKDLKLEVPGNGRAITVPIDGYMGAKAPFVESRV